MDPLWIDDRALGRAVVERGLAPREVVLEAFTALAPGARLAHALVERRIVAPEVLLALARSLAEAGATAIEPGGRGEVLTLMGNVTPTDDVVTLALGAPGVARAADEVAAAHATTVIPGGGPGKEPPAEPRPDVTGGPPKPGGAPDAFGRWGPSGGLLGPGSVVSGRFRLESRLGRGGMGEVWRATEAGTGRVVALKLVFRGSSGLARARFQREVELGARVDAAGGIVRMIAAGEHEAQPWLAMELVLGESFAAVIGRGPVAPERAARLVEATARAVGALHAAGILHRDLKPDNVLVRADDGAPRLADFGLARDINIAERLTKTGDMLGTPAYMAPEQASDSARAIDVRVDVYGLGGILYAGLTGRPPFQGPAVNIIRCVLMEDPVWPAERLGGIPPELDAICRKAMAKDPRDRYATALDLALDLGRALRGEPVLARPLALAERLRRRWETRGGKLIVATLVGSALLGALSILLGVRRAAHLDLDSRVADEQGRVARLAFTDGAGAGPEDDLAARRAPLERWPVVLQGDRQERVAAALRDLESLGRLARHRHGLPVDPPPPPAGRAFLDLLVDAEVLAASDGRAAWTRFEAARGLASADQELLARVALPLLEARFAAGPGLAGEALAELARLDARLRASPRGRALAERAVALAVREALRGVAAPREDRAGEAAFAGLGGLLDQATSFLGGERARDVVVAAKREALEASAPDWLRRWDAVGRKDEAAAQRLLNELTAVVRGAPPLDEVRGPELDRLRRELLTPAIEAHARAERGDRVARTLAALRLDLRCSVLGWTPDDRLDLLIQDWYVHPERPGVLPAMLQVAMLRCTFPFGRTAAGLADDPRPDLDRELAALARDFPGSAAIRLLQILRGLDDGPPGETPEQVLARLTPLLDALRELLARPVTDLSPTYVGEAWLRLAQAIMKVVYVLYNSGAPVPPALPREAHAACVRARAGVVPDLLLDAWHFEACAAGSADGVPAQIASERAAVASFRERLARATSGEVAPGRGGALVGAGAPFERDALSRALARLGESLVGVGQQDEALLTFEEALKVASAGVAGSSIVPHVRGLLARLHIERKELDAAQALICAQGPDGLRDATFAEAVIRLAAAREDLPRAREALRQARAFIRPGSNAERELVGAARSVGVE